MPCWQLYNYLPYVEKEQCRGGWDRSIGRSTSRVVFPGLCVGRSLNPTGGRTGEIPVEMGQGVLFQLNCLGTFSFSLFLSETASNIFISSGTIFDNLSFSFLDRTELNSLFWLSAINPSTILIIIAFIFFWVWMFVGLVLFCFGSLVLFW